MHSGRRPLSRPALASPGPRAGALFGVPTLLCAVLVLWGLGRAPFWRDEAASITIADRPLDSMWGVIVHHESNMALFDVVLSVWRLLGDGEGFLRLPSAACAIAAVPVTMLVARRIAGDVAAAVAGVTLALNAFMLVYGQQERGYALMMLLSAMAALALLTAMHERRTRDWVVWTLAIGLLPYAHLLGALIVVALVASLAFYPRAALPVRAMGTSLLAAAVLWAPLAIFLVAGDNNRTTWVEPLGQALVRQTAERLAGDRAMLAVLVVATLIVGAGLAATLRGAGGSDPGAAGQRRWHLALPICWVVIPPVLLGVICLHQQMWVDRYLIGIVPGLAVLAGVAVTLARARLGSAVAAALATVIGLAALHAATAVSHPAPPMGEDLRAAAARIVAGQRPGDQLVYAPAFARVGIEYYLDRLGGPRPADLALARSAVDRGDLFASELPPPVVAQRIEAARRLWVVGYGFRADWHPTPEPVTEVAPAILRRDFRRSGHWRFGVMDVQLYTR
jgi:mannosyltransferase